MVTIAEVNAVLREWRMSSTPPIPRELLHVIANLGTRHLQKEWAAVGGRSSGA